MRGWPAGMLLRGLVTILALLSAACATRPRGVDPVALAALAAHEAEVAGRDFDLGGRIGFSNARQAGSATFTWTQRGKRLRFELRVALAGESWILEGEPGRYRLAGGDGAVRSGPDADRLLTTVTGWQVPVAQLRHWIQGARAPRAAADIRLDATGRLVELRQSGWVIQYRRHDEHGKPRLIVARRADSELRVSLQEFTLP